LNLRSQSPKWGQWKTKETCQLQEKESGNGWIEKRDGLSHTDGSGPRSIAKKKRRMSSGKGWGAHTSPGKNEKGTVRTPKPKSQCGEQERVMGTQHQKKGPIKRKWVLKTRNKVPSLGGTGAKSKVVWGANNIKQLFLTAQGARRE